MGCGLVAMLPLVLAFLPCSPILGLDNCLRLVNGSLRYSSAANLGVKSV